VVPNEPVEDRAPFGQPLERADLIDTHEPAVALHICCEDPRRLPNDYGRLSGAPSRQRRRHLRYGPYGVGGRRPSLWRYKDGCVLDHPGLGGYDPDQARLPSIGLVDPQNQALGIKGWNEWFLGHPYVAVQAAAEGLKGARNRGHPQGLEHALDSAAHTHLLRHEPEVALGYIEEALAISRGQGFSYRLILTSLFRGWALMLLGDSETAAAELSEGVGRFRASGDRGQFHVIFLGILAEAYRRLDLIEEGLA
jgi:hypothetical protein